MPGLIQPMGSVLLTWLLLFLLFSGLGLLALRMLGRTVASGWRWLDSFWLGWALALGIMQVWHIASPVDETLLLLLAGGAALLLISQGGCLRAIGGRLARKPAFLLIFGLLALWMSNRALGLPTAYDTGFRDIQAVSWIDAFPIIPGLGNLFSSLAFNQSVYLYDALLDASIWSGRSVYIATGLLIMVYLAYAVGAALEVLRSRAAAEARWSRLFASLTIPFFLFQTVRAGGITHFLTDTAVELIGFMTMIYLLDFLQCWRPQGPSNAYLAQRLALIILTGFTIKQSYIVYGLATAALFLIVWIRRGGLRMRPVELRRTVLPIALAALALLLPWMARGVITSGYIAYPQSLGRVEVDWALPAEAVETRQRTLATNTRHRGGDPGVVLASWDWLGPWLHDFARSIFPTMLPTCLSAIALLLYLIGSRRKPRERRAPGLGPWALLPMMIMLTVWFFTAPEDKYVRYILWSFAALSVVLAALAWHWIAWRRRLLAIFALVLVCLAYVAFLIVRHDEILIPAGAHDGFHARAQPDFERFETDYGLILHVPLGVNQCWDIPLPCTPHPHAAISARIPGELRHGFRIEPSGETG